MSEPETDHESSTGGEETQEPKLTDNKWFQVGIMFPIGIVFVKIADKLGDKAADRVLDQAVGVIDQAAPVARTVLRKGFGMD